MPRAFDRQQIAVDRNPLNQLQVDFGKLPKLELDPVAILEGFVAAIKESTGIDLASVTALIGSFGAGAQALFDFIDDLVNELIDVPAFLGVLKEVVDFFTDLADRSGFLAALESVIEFITGAVDGLPGVDLDDWLSRLGEFVEFLLGLLTPAGFLTALEQIVDFIRGAGGVDLTGWLNQLGDLVSFFIGLLNPAGFLSTLEQVILWFGEILNLGEWLDELGDIVGFFVGLLNPAGFRSLLKTFIDWFETISEAARVPFLNILKQMVEGLGAVINVPAFMTALRTFVNGLLGILDLGTWTTTLTTIINGLLNIGNLSTWVGVLRQVIDFFVTITADVRAGFLTALETVVTTFQGLFVGGSLADWLAGIPSFAQNIIDGLWSAVSGGAAAVGKTIEEALSAVGDWAASVVRDITGQDFGDIASWARNLLTKGLGWNGLFDLFGSIPAAILGVLPIPAINVVNPELMARGGFDTSATLAEGSGWSWDGTQRYPPTETTGGSAKVLGASTTRTLFANQSIEVAEGDKLLISCFVKSTGSVGSGGIRIDVVQFNGTAQGSTVPIAQRNGSAAWVQLGNSEAAPYVVPAGVTNIRVKLSITVAAVTGSVVWFDAISVKKIGLLDGNWMSGILGTVADDFQEIVDSIKSAVEETATTGNPLTAVKPVIETIFTRLFGLAFLPVNLALQPLLEVAIPGLNGDKITDGTVSADFLPISDIGDELGTAITTGSGAKMSRRNTTTKVTAVGFVPPATPTVTNAKFNLTFYDNVDQVSADITASASTGRFTVTHAGYYLVEVAFTTNANEPAAGYFNVSPTVYINGSTTPYKVGADSLGSFGGGFGNYSRSAHSTFITYIPAGGYVEAGYVNFGARNNLFFEGDTAGNSTYFSIAMLNRTAEG